jgi:hypothetical protein
LKSTPEVRTAVVALALTACGRFGFESEPGDGGATGDAAQASCPGTARVPDEDNDLIGDPCDVCPHVADQAQEDRDGDRVGDACDPEIAIARQTIRFFHGFNADLPEWTGGGVIEGGQLVVEVTNTESISVLGIPTGTSMLQVAGAIVGVGVDAQLFIGAAPGTDLYYVELIVEGTGRRRSLMRDLSSVYTELDGVRDPQPIQPGPFVMSLSIGADQLSSTVEAAGTAPVSLMANGTGTINGDMGVIYVNQLSVVFDYAIQIDTGP